MNTPFHVMAKPIGPICNLDCAYCYYLEKEAQYPATGSWRIEDATLETYIRQYIEAHDSPEIGFAWQGGEPTLLGVSFFEHVIELQNRYADGKRITNSIQTNGTLLDDEWCQFLQANMFLVGISIDGPRELHDRFRVDKNARPTFDLVMRGLNLLKKHGVEFNTLTVVSRANSSKPLDVYHFLKEIGSRYIQFIPVVERVNGLSKNGLIQLAPPMRHNSEDRSKVTPWSVGSVAFGDFLVAVFDEWVRQDVGNVFVQMFDIALGQWAGEPAGLCVFDVTCGRGLAMERNGDVFSCDHYVYPEYRLGNVNSESLREMADSARQLKFGDDKRDLLVDDCVACDVRFACNGDCPKHRFRRSSSGQMGLSYLCPSYKRFFSHVDPYMRTMASLLKAQRPPAEIMRMISVDSASGAKSGVR
ncbi:MAG TPA: anaerobic sulfatase maturase [Capsulimonadaceae bacterium]|jgi:uncharacterized protein